jgi:hypothetical protein
MCNIHKLIPITIVTGALFNQRKTAKAELAPDFISLNAGTVEVYTVSILSS